MTTAADDFADRILIKTQDPEHTIGPGPVPALTTLLLKVCDRDHKKFDEAVRIIKLFIAETKKEVTE